MTITGYRITAALIFIFGILLGCFVFLSERPSDSFLARFPFKLGLDLSGGTHLLYKADISTLPEEDRSDSFNALRDVIERRINIFGVSEPVVQTEVHSDEAGNPEGRLIIELPGVTEINEAIQLIGATPVLEFKVETEEFEKIRAKLEQNSGTSTPIENPETLYVSTGLTGEHLTSAQIQFNTVTGEPLVVLNFNDEGKKLFAKITEDNIGKTVAIFLDGSPITTPYVREAITTGQAQIEGQFTPEYARELVGSLNAGALPIPISLLSTQTIGASLGDEAVAKGLKAGIVGLLFVSLFMVVWYRLPGFLAVVSLTFYMVLVLSLFKLIPVTLTAAGIAGFILSIGIAVDANILIFERLKEELFETKKMDEAIDNGFSRAWFSIRDANLTSILSAVILFWFGTGVIKGFALTLTIGIIVSMLSAIVVTKIFIKALGLGEKTNRIVSLMGSGFR